MTNSGPDDAADVVVTDTLDPNTTFVSSSIPCSGGGTLSCDLGTVPFGTSVTFNVVVYIESTAPTGSTLTGPSCPGGEDVCDQVAVTSSTCDPSLSNNEAEVATDVVVPTVFSELTLTKSDVTPEPVLPGDNVTYEIVVFNAGMDDADDVVVYETLDPYMTYVSDDAGCTVTAILTPTGTLLTCPLGTIPPGSSATLTVVVTIALDAPVSSSQQDGNCDTLEDVCNYAVVGTSSSDSDFGDNRDYEPTDVSPAVGCGNGSLDPGEQCDPPSGEVCNNTADDDGDLLVDCADPDCLTPGFQSCDGACQLTPACVPILDDPARLTSRLITVHGRYIPTTDANPALDGFVFLVTNEDGDVYRGRLLPGDMQLVGGKNLLRWVFKDRAARKGAGTRDGIYRVGMKQRREPDGSISYPFKIKAFADMSRANEARMTTQVYVGDDVGHLTATWLGEPGRWKLTREQAEAGRSALQ